MPGEPGSFTHMKPLPASDRMGKVNQYLQAVCKGEKNTNVSLEHHCWLQFDQPVHKTWKGHQTIFNQWFMQWLELSCSCPIAATAYSSLFVTNLFSAIFRPYWSHHLLSNELPDIWRKTFNQWQVVIIGHPPVWHNSVCQWRPKSDARANTNYTTKHAQMWKEYVSMYLHKLNIPSVTCNAWQVTWLFVNILVWFYCSFWSNGLWKESACKVYDNPSTNSADGLYPRQEIGVM